MARFHNAMPRTSDHHPTMLGHGSTKVGGLLIGGCSLGVRAEPKIVTLRSPPIRLKNLEGVAKFAKRAAEYLEIASSRSIFFQTVDGTTKHID